MAKKKGLMQKIKRMFRKKPVPIPTRPVYLRVSISTGDITEKMYVLPDFAGKNVLEIKDYPETMNLSDIGKTVDMREYPTWRKQKLSAFGDALEWEQIRGYLR
jgi:hypothetical protein